MGSRSTGRCTSSPKRRASARRTAQRPGRHMPAIVETERLPITSSPIESPSSQRLAWIVFAALLAAACDWIVSLPVFPSQDGAVHVYYAKVTRDLMAGHSTYAHDFRVARPLPPYSLHAYLLMAFLPWTSSEMAEKLLACVSVVMCGLGFAYFAHRLGRSAPFACALAVPFLLNRFLFLGFYGYLIGVGLALLTAGLWLRNDRTLRRLMAFLGLTLLTMFAHPVPYMILIAFCWSVAAAGWLNQRQPGRDVVAFDAPTRNDVIELVVATACFAAFKHY